MINAFSQHEDIFLQIEQIETTIGYPLEWNPNPNNKDKTIALYKQFELYNKENWDEAIEWLASHSIKFKSAFTKVMRKK